jgi:cytochrome P450
MAIALSMPRETIEDVLIEGIKIPKGTTLVVVPDAVHRNPVIWGTDCDEFRPGRWDNPKGNAANPYAFQSFNGGVRICLGRALGLLELKTILVELLLNFTFESCKTITTYKNPSFTLQPADGLDVIFRNKRNRK